MKHGVPIYERTVTVSMRFWSSWPRSSAKRGGMKEIIAVDDTGLPVFARALYNVATIIVMADEVFRRLSTSKCRGTFQRSNS